MAWIVGLTIAACSYLASPAHAQTPALDALARVPRALGHGPAPLSALSALGASSQAQSLMEAGLFSAPGVNTILTEDPELVVRLWESAGMSSEGARALLTALQNQMATHVAGTLAEPGGGAASRLCEEQDLQIRRLATTLASAGTLGGPVWHPRQSPDLSFPYQSARTALRADPNREYAKLEGRDYSVKRDLAGFPELQTANEVITSALYRELGYRSPRTELVEADGKRHAFVEWMPAVDGWTHSSLAHDTRVFSDNSQFRQLRIFAAWLKDWDRLRMGPNNLVTESGDAYLYDFGGSLGARAAEGLKPGPVWSNAVGAFEATSDGSQIIADFDISWLDAWHPWHNLTADDVKAARAALAGVTNETIDRIVAHARYSDPHDTWYVSMALKTRRDALIRDLDDVFARGGFVQPPVTTPPRGYRLSSPQDLIALQDGWAQTLPENVAGSLNAWTFGSTWSVYGHGLRHYLETGRDPNPERIGGVYQLETTQRIVGEIDAAMDSAPRLPKRTVLFRSFALEEGEPTPVGQTYKLDYYTSTSLSRTYAEQRLKVDPDSEEPLEGTLVLQRILLPKAGVRGVFQPGVFRHHPDAYDEFTEEYVPQELEVTLQRGLVFRVKSSETTVIDGREVVLQDVEVIDSEKNYRRVKQMAPGNPDADRD